MRRSSTAAFLLAAVVTSFGLGQNQPQMQTAQSDEKLGEKRAEAKRLGTAVRDAYSSFAAGFARSNENYFSLTVITRRFDENTALVSLAVNTNDPSLHAETPKVDLTLQPGKLTRVKLEKIGVPTQLQLGGGGGSPVPIGSPLQKLNTIITAPQEADAIEIRFGLSTRLGRRGFTYKLSLKDAESTGTVALSGYQFGTAANKILATEDASFLPAAYRTFAERCERISVTCGSCTQSANCNVGGGHNEPDIICNCSSNPCSCGIICDGGCPPEQ